jgi:hypothetical protein
MPRTFIKPEWEEMWCEALRSGDYEQATNGQLAELGHENFPIGYCCLGVLQELIYPNCFFNDHEEAETEWPRAEVTNEVAIAPGVVLGGEIIGFFSVLADMNDKSVPFDIIANLIERYNRGDDIYGPDPRDLGDA